MGVSSGVEMLVGQVTAAQYVTNRQNGMSVENAILDAFKEARGLEKILITQSMVEKLDKIMTDTES